MIMTSSINFTELKYNFQ